MRKLFFVQSGFQGGVSEGFPVTTTHPNGSPVSPRIEMGRWWRNDHGWNFAGDTIQIEPGVELTVGANGGLVAKRGEVRRETTGLWLRQGSNELSSGDVCVWFTVGAPEHYFTSNGNPETSNLFQTENCDLLHCDQTGYLLANMHEGSVLKLYETRKVRRAGTGRSWFNFPDLQDVTRLSEKVEVRRTEANGVYPSLIRELCDLEVELYKFAGSREIITVQSTVGLNEMKRRAAVKDYTSYDEVIR